MTRQGRATLYALIAVLLWSTIASAFKLSLRYLEPIQLLLYAGSSGTPGYPSQNSPDRHNQQEETEEDQADATECLRVQLFPEE